MVLQLHKGTQTASCNVDFQELPWCIGSCCFNALQSCSLLKQLPENLQTSTQMQVANEIHYSANEPGHKDVQIAVLSDE